MIRFHSAALGLCVLALSACATAPQHRSDVESVTIELKGRPGEISTTRYYSNARIQGYQDGQILRDRMEAVDFSVETNVQAFDPVKKTIRFTTQTVRKDGIVSLHDLAFPELNEKIDYVVKTDGEVLQAGKFGRTSLFFVPSMPTPGRPVKIGDTWPMEHTWLSAKDSIPLKLEILAILKDIVSCDGGKVCADVELSGHVALVTPPTARGGKFTSRIWGRMLFSVERGDVVWSEMRSAEQMGIEGDRMDVLSCMISETKLKGDFKSSFKCEPAERPVTKIPAI